MDGITNQKRHEPENFILLFAICLHNYHIDEKAEHQPNLNIMIPVNIIIKTA